MGNQFIDFNHVKENADVTAVIGALGIEVIKTSNSEIRIHCVMLDHDDKRASCDVNTDNKAFYCHSCKGNGSILDLVSIYKDCDLREAAKFTAEASSIHVSARSHSQARGRKHSVKSAGGSDEPHSPTHKEDQAAPEVKTWLEVTPDFKEFG